MHIDLLLYLFVVLLMEQDLVPSLELPVTKANLPSLTHSSPQINRELTVEVKVHSPLRAVMDWG